MIPIGTALVSCTTPLIPAVIPPSFRLFLQSSNIKIRCSCLYRPWIWNVLPVSVACAFPAIIAPVLRHEVIHARQGLVFGAMASQKILHHHPSPWAINQKQNTSIHRKRLCGKDFKFTTPAIWRQYFVTFPDNPYMAASPVLPARRYSLES
jgi:hypothetical protein